MNKENTDKLLEAGPTLYGKGRPSFRRRGPDDSPAPFYFECGDGWFPLLLKLTQQVEQEIALQPSASWDSFGATQVKEKFGTLRFYMYGENEIISELIEQAELESAKTCEQCGKPGKLTDRKGWLTTACERCARGY